MTRRTTWVAVLLFASGLVRAADPPPPPAAVRVFAVGDWGIDSPARVEVGRAMADRAREPGHKPDAALLLGDNFYVKLKDTRDARIRTFFEETYDESALPMPFYAVLGNHDYATHDDGIELAYAAAGGTRFTMPSRWYRLDLPAGATRPLVTVLMLDSDHDTMGADRWAAELAWLKAEAAKPHGKWLVAAAHHGLFGNGSHGDNGVLQKEWGPTLRAAGVAFYVNGHEHTLQHLELPGWPVSFVVAGGGGAGNKPMLKDNRGPFSASTHGFAELSFTADKATVNLIGADGVDRHAFDRTPDGTVTVTANSPSDKATKHPLKTINGGD